MFWILHRTCLLYKQSLWRLSVMWTSFILPGHFKPNVYFNFILCTEGWQIGTVLLWICHILQVWWRILFTQLTGPLWCLPYPKPNPLFPFLCPIVGTVPLVLWWCKLSFVDLAQHQTNVNICVCHLSFSFILVFLTTPFSFSSPQVVKFGWFVLSDEQLLCLLPWETLIKNLAILLSSRISFATVFCF